MESSDNLGERASKQRNRKCKGPVVADEGMDWRVSMWGGGPVDGYSGKGPLRMGHVNKDLDGRRSQSLLEAGAPNRRKNRLEPQARLSSACLAPKASVAG